MIGNKNSRIENRKHRDRRKAKIASLIAANLREFPPPDIMDQERERGLCAGKSAIGFQKLIVSCLICAFRAERRARIDRGARDIAFEPCSGRVRRDFGMCIFTL